MVPSIIGLAEPLAALLNPLAALLNPLAAPAYKMPRPTWSSVLGAVAIAQCVGQLAAQDEAGISIGERKATKVR